MAKKRKKKTPEIKPTDKDEKHPPTSFDPFKARTVWLIAIFAIAIILRIVYFIQNLSMNPLYYDPISDAGVYYNWAKDIVEGTPSHQGVFYMAPLYPYILAFIFNLFGVSVSAAAIVQHVAGILNLLLVYLIANKVFGGRVAIIATILCLLHPPLMFHESKILLETFAILFYLLSLYLLLFQQKERLNIPLSFLTGLALGVSTVQRPNILLFIVLVIIWFFILFKPKYNWAIITSLILIIGVIIPILPVTIHNYKVSGEFVLLTYNTGINFYYGSDPEAAPTFTRRVTVGDSIETEEESAKKIAEKETGKKLGPSGISAFWMKRGFQQIRKDFFGWISYQLKKIYWSMNTYEIANNYNIQFERAQVPILKFLFIPYGLIFLLAIIGIGLTSKRDPKIILLLFYMGAIFAGLIIFTVVGRFRLTLTVILTMFAGYGLLEYIDTARKRNFDIAASRRYLAATLAIVILAAPTLVPYRKTTNPASTYHNLGVIEYRKGNYQKAIEYHELALKTFPHYPEAYNDMGSCYLKLNDEEKALEMYSKADESSPTYAESRFNAGLIYMRRKDYPNAKRKFEEALKIRPDYIKAKMNLAFTLFYLRNFDEAISLMRDLVSLYPNNATHHYNLGAMLKAKGQNEEAKKEFEKSVSLDPDYEEAKKELAKFQ